MALKKDINMFVNLARYARKVCGRPFYVDYDSEADVLYISFQTRRKATESRLDGDILTRFDGSEVIGITIMHASEKVAPKRKAGSFPKKHYASKPLQSNPQAKSKARSTTT